mgnify:CR=1 FL=1
MRQFSVLHMQKYKELGGIGAHLDRTYIQHNVDAERKELNEELSGLGDLALEQAIEARIAEGYTLSKSIRKDAVKAVGVLMTGSHERMKEVEKDEKLFREWQTSNYRFACKEFGKKNIVRFVVHRDEKTPHIHCVFVPNTAKGGLSAKEYMKGKECMRGYQNRYGREMEKFGLERGLPQEITQAVHIPSKAYYRDANLRIRESQEQTAKINVKNVLKLREIKGKVERDLTQEKVLLESFKRRIEQVEKTSARLYKQEIDRDLKRVKQEVNLVQHASSMGYKLDKTKSCRSYAVMEKEGDKVIINTSPNHHGHWVYMSAVDESDRGTIVDFMLKRGYDFREIRKLSSIHLNNEPLQELSKSSEVVEDVQVQYRVSKGTLKEVQQEHGTKYLERRKIDEKTYKCYLGESMALGANKAVFGLYRDINSQGEGRLCSTITYGYDKDGQSRKYFQKGLPRGLSMLREKEVKIKQIVICESPIDALSYKQQHGNDKESMYVSTCGSLSKGVREELEKVLAGAREHAQSVTLAFDRDEGGLRMSNQLKTMCEGLSLICSIRYPLQGAKDWNEELEQDRKAKVKKKQQRQFMGLSM